MKEEEETSEEFARDEMRDGGKQMRKEGEEEKLENDEG